MVATQNVFEADSASQPHQRWEILHNVNNYCVNLMVLVALTKTTNQWLTEDPVACQSMPHI
jgi:hypothetical protein